ncbi:MAG: hypothetical protein U1E45_10685 [Geminicoccaceae bacterium]
MDGPRGYAFRAPASCGTDAEAWAWIVDDLARTSGIADAGLLDRTLRQALHYAAIYDGGGGMVRQSDGQLVAVAPGAMAEARQIADLAAALDAAIAAAALPVGGVPAAALRTALAGYQEHLASLDFRTKDGRTTKRPKSRAGFIVVALAANWPLLTGSKPTAWRDGSNDKPGGAFALFVQKVCVAFGLDAPSVGTIRAAIEHAASN